MSRLNLRTSALALIAACLVGCSGGSGESSDSSSTTGGENASAQSEMKLPEGAVHVGKDITVAKAVSLGKLRQDPDSYLDQTVIIEARAANVCQTAGCWMTLADDSPGDPVLVVWSSGCGGEYEFPKDCSGQKVYVQGQLSMKEISEETAEHLAGESDGLEVEDIQGKAFEVNATAFVVLPAAATTS